MMAFMRGIGKLFSGNWTVAVRTKAVHRVAPGGTFGG
jgi:hypothetical protein